MNPWICPRCKTVWAGWVAKCDCKYETYGSGNTYEVQCTCHLKKDVTGHLCPVHDVQSSSGWPLSAWMTDWLNDPEEDEAWKDL